MSTVVPIEQVSMLVTDASADAEEIAALERAGCEVVIARSQTTGAGSRGSRNGRRSHRPDRGPRDPAATCSASKSRSSRCATSRGCRAARATTDAAWRPSSSTVARELEALQDGRGRRDPLLQRDRHAVPDRCRAGGRGGDGGGHRSGALDLRVPFGVEPGLGSGSEPRGRRVATGASFVREVFTGVFESDLGLMRARFRRDRRLPRAHRRRTGRAVQQHHARVRQHRRRAARSPSALAARPISASTRS